jgi:hypothetical protein
MANHAGAQAKSPACIDNPGRQLHAAFMKKALFVLGFCVLGCPAQPVTKEFVGKEQPGAMIERFSLKGPRTYDGIWDAPKSQIHIVVKTNHVGNLPVSTNDIVARKAVGDGSHVKLYSDVDMAEKVLLLNLQNYKAAQARLAAATRNRDNLHQSNHGKNLPTPAYNAVMVQYKAADDEIANAGKALEAARTAFGKAQEAYQKAGGKTEYSLP